MANQNGRPVAPARKLVAAVVGTIAVFVMLFGLGMSSWAIVALGLAMLILAVGLGMVNVVRRGARAWVAGTAEVKSISEPPATAIYGRAELQIVIVAPGLPTSEVTVRDPRVPVVKWPRVGDTLPVTVDVDDMRRVRIDWDEAETYEQTTQNVPPTYYDDDLPDDDLLGGEPEPPPWAARDRQWGRGPDEPPPPPPPSPRTGDLDGPPPPPPRAGLLDEPPPPVIVRDSPGGPIVEGQLVEPDYEYSSPLPQRARTATAPPPRPAADKPRPRPRPHATATLDPEAAEAEGEGAAPAPAQRTPQEPVTAHDPDIDLSLDADPESTPAAGAAVQDDIIAKPAFSGPDQADEEVAEPDSRPSEPSTDNRAARVLDAENGPRQRSADDDLLGDLEPPPWTVRAQQPSPEPDADLDPDPGPDPDLDLDLDPGPETGGSPASSGPVGSVPADRGRSGSGAAGGGGTGSASAPDASRPAAESRPRPRESRPDDAPRAERPMPDTGEQPKNAAPTPGLAAAAGAVMAAGIAAFGNALRGKKHEERREGPTSAAQRPEAAGPTRIDAEFPATAATGRESTGNPDPEPAAGPSTAGEPKSNVGLGAVSATRSGPGPDRAPASDAGPAAPAAGPTAPTAGPTVAAAGPAADSAAAAASSTAAEASPAAAAAGPTAAASAAARPVGSAAPAADAAPVSESNSARASGSPVGTGQVYASPTAFGPGGGSGKGNLAEAKPRPEPTPIRPGTLYAAGPVPEASPPTTSRSHTAPRPEPAPAGGRRSKPWADLEGGFEPDERADDVITAYPSARPGPAGAIHGVGITVLVTNLERSVAFYREMLGFYEIDTGSGSAVLASGDTRLVLRTVHDLSNAAGRLIYLNLEVGDVEAIYEELKRKGVKFVHGPRPVNRGDKLELWAASFHDPDQHNIAITQWRAIR